MVISGLGILQDFYLWSLFFYFVTATIMGIYWLIYLFKKHQLKSKFTILSLILVFNCPLFLIFFLEFGKIVRHFFDNFLTVNNVKMHQESVFISIFFVALQLFLTIYLNQNLHNFQANSPNLDLKK